MMGYVCSFGCRITAENGKSLEKRGRLKNARDLRKEGRVASTVKVIDQ